MSETGKKVEHGERDGRSATQAARSTGRAGDADRGQADRSQADRKRGPEADSSPGSGAAKSKSLARGLHRRVERGVERTVSRQGAAYQGAFEAVFAILIAFGLGYWADQRLDSAPVGMLTGIVLGFAAFVLRLMRLRGLIEGPSEEEEPDAGAAAPPGAARSRSPDRGPERDSRRDPAQNGIEGS
ncbi:MAG: AtpZ/AtpI family protein [Myxococcota bacterium]